VSGASVRPDPLATWRLKLAELENELAIDSNASAKFEIRQRIAEAKAEIARLEAEQRVGTSNQSAPSHQGPLWNVPIAINPFFTGREQTLKQLEGALKSGGRAGICGMGGLGKTETAAHYAHTHRAEYGGVFWVDADSRETLLKGFAAIATLLGLPEGSAADQSLVLNAVRRWLAAAPSWLLILDNANNLPILSEFMPQDGNGHVILTTQAQALGPLAEPTEINKLEPDEGALFLLRRARILKKDQPLSTARDTDRDSARQISTEMDGLPLALDQAGAYIEETGQSPQAYLTLYCEQGQKLRSQRGGIPSRHPDSVVTTFSLAFAKAEKADPAAADLFRLCAFLHADAIPEEIVTDGGSDLGPLLATLAADTFRFNAAVAEARKYSLLRRDAETRSLSIHRLVQAVIRDGLGAVAEREWAERAVRALNNAFPSVEFENWQTCERLAPSALACAALIGAFAIESTQAARLLNQIGFYLGERARFSEAQPHYQRSLGIYERVLGPEHRDVARSLNNLAGLYDSQGKYEEAEPLYKRSLGIREKVLGPEHPDVATSLNNLAALYDSQGKYEEAEPLYKRSLGIREKVLGPEHPHVATSLNNLALLYRNQGKYEEAEPLYKRSFAIREKVLGPEHPDVAISLNNLARLYDSQGKYEEAEPLYKRSFAIREKALGPEHPDVANSLNNLAGLYDNQGKYQEAEPLYKRALGIVEKVLGPEHPDVAISLNNLALLYSNQGKYQEAEPLYKRSFAIREKVLGPEHPDVADSLNNLAGLYDSQGKYEEAEPLYKRSFAIREKVLGQEHPDVANSLNNLAALYDDQGKYQEAEPLYKRALGIREKVLGPEHPHVATCLNNLAGLYSGQGKYEEAELLYQRSLGILEKALGPEHPRTATVRANYSELLRKMGRSAKAGRLKSR
jgi:tetratricopeptide (TPR) repeat protein/uncharacterized small protein (DUF1192 family)